MKSVISIIFFIMLIKATMSMSCNVEEYQDTRWTKITCYNLTSPSQIQFSYVDINNFRQVLSIVDSKIAKLPPKGFTRFPTIFELVLTDNQIHELEAGAFDGLIKAEFISINRNWITEVPEGVFTSDLEQLEYLNMEANEIREVTRNAFKNLASLKNLHLRSNKVATLEKGAFCDLTALRTLGLSWNLLTEFKDYEMFGNSTDDAKNFSHNLRFLFLNNNRITSFVVKNLKQLQWINLGFNNLFYLERDSFAGLSKLQDLEVSNNFIKILPGQLFRSNFKLEFLRMFNNRISILERGVFQDFYQIYSINLVNNSLTEFHDFDLWADSENIVNVSKSLYYLRLRNNLIASVSVSNCKPVRYVYFDHNNLSYLQPDIFSNLPNMIELDISVNPLVTSLPQQLCQGAVSLRGLYLNNLTISKLPCGIFKDLKELKQLELHYNYLEEFNDCCLFGGPSNRDCNNKLTDIFLHHNLISSVSLTHSSNMGYVHLEHNNISCVRDSNFGGLSNLRLLDLSNNLISKFFPSSLKGNKNLQKVNLASNKISKLEPGTFSDQTHLTILNMSNNLLAEFEILDLWNGSESNLKTLDLSENLINTFQVSSKNLQLITLAYNNISYMKPGMFRDLPLLTTINLSHNNIHRIPFGVFQNLTSLQDLNLSYNRLKKFNHYLLKGKTNPKNLDFSNNQINSFVVRKLKEHLTNLLSVSLVNNSFTCDALAQLEYQLQNLDVTLVMGEAIDVENIGGIACDADQDY